MTDTFFGIRGIVEGFYGVFYTHAERLSLIRFAGQHGYNLYIFAPKNDRYHRWRWRELYLARTMAELAESVMTARASGVTFGYALGPGLSISYASEQDFRALTAKFKSLHDIGVRAFSLFLDDITPGLLFEADRQRYGSYAEAHADLCNRTYAWLQALDPACTLSMCPTDYACSAPFSDYLQRLGEDLNPAIDVFYTGPQVCSGTITAADAGAFGGVLRRPPLIWDNYPVNDGDMAAEMHLAPIRGRDAELYQAVRGVVVNPMNQAEASKIALATFADYFADPQGYDPAQAWERALHEVGGASAGELRVFGELSLFSCLGAPQDQPLPALVSEALLALDQGETLAESSAVRALDAYLVRVDDAIYHLTYDLQNVALRNELLPWLELLELWLRLAQRSLIVLRAMEHGEPYDEALQRMNALLASISKHPKRLGADALLLLAHYALRRAQVPLPQDQALAPAG